MNGFPLHRFPLFLIAALLLLISCGGGSSPVKEPPSPPVEEPPSTPPQEPPITPPFTPIQVPLYLFTDLGVLGGYAGSEAKAINDRGQVVGSSWRWSDNPELPWEEAFLWENGQLFGLGVLPPWGEYSRAVAINNLGQMVGEGDNPSFHSFFWEADGTLRDLFLNEGNESTAFDINDRGQVVGFNFKSRHPQAYLWENEQVIELGEEFGESYAFAINNAGQVAGEMWPVTGVTEDDLPIWTGPRAFLWERETVSDLGIFGSATDLNAGGQIVGSLSAGDRAFRDRAFLWQDGTITELGHLGGEDSRAAAINDAGQVVGASRKLPYDPARPDSLLSENYSATLWERGRLRDLNQLADTGEAHLQWAFDINISGQIVGRALTDDTEHAFLLTPQWQGRITGESSFSTTVELGERLIFDYWADSLPDSGSSSPFTIEVMVMDAFGNWSFLGQVEEPAASAAWKTALVQVPDNLIGTNKEISLQLSVYHVAADPILFVKSFRAQLSGGAVNNRVDNSVAN